MPDSQRPEGAVSPWLALTVIMCSTIMVSLDSTIVNIALHQIAVDLHALANVEWVVSAYVLAVCVAQPASGWLADRLGRKRLFILSLVGFTAASALCALAPNLPVLVIARVLQGLGGGALMPVGMAIVLELFPREQHGRALGVWGLAAMLAPAIGPVVGGWLVTAVSWHWLFLINVPIGVITFVLAVRLLPQSGERLGRSFDALGLVLGCGGLSLLVLALSQANSWGWASPSILGLLVVGGLAIALFIPHELRTAQPFIEVRLFARPSYRLAIVAMMLMVFAQFGRLVFIPLQLQALRGESALMVGVLFVPAAIATAITMPLAGRIVDRGGSRTPGLIGAAIMAIGVASLSRLTLTSPLWVISLGMFVQGLGYGMAVTPAMVAGLSDLPPELTSQGAAVRSLAGQVGNVIAVAGLGAVVAATTPDRPTPLQSQHAYNHAFTVMAIGTVLLVLLSTRLPRTTAGARTSGEELMIGE